ncbi:uncharacterized protein LOC116257263 isoform X3 [Nymphaea colorata]|nr:uncharacterized protein LOC116257263 isoform X3 [Nymphaea colorata]
MDDDGGGADDHGSGWLEVKKRHRVSAPKISSQNLIGGKSNTLKTRRVAAHFRKSTSQKLVNRHCTTISHPPNGLHNLPGGVKNSAGISDFYDRKHVNQESKDCISSQIAGSLTEEASCLIKFVDEGGHGKVIEERSTKESVVSDNLKDIVSKIRWGNLDNDSFVVNKNLHSTSRSLEINCMSENSTLHGGQQVSEPNLLACADSLEEKDVPISEATVHFSAGQDEVVEGKDDNEVNIVASDITIIHDIKPEGVASNGGVDTLSESYTEYFDASLKLNEVADIVVANVSDPLSENIHLLAAGQDKSLTEMLTCGDAVSVIAEGALESAVHGIFTSHSQDAAACASSSCVSPGDFSVIHENETCDDHVRGTPRDDMVDKTGILVEKPVDMKLANDHLTVDVKLENDHLVDDLAKDETGGSKERFRERLWCFLFENLNRAVDELYLLCELECDMEQMNEAILVLEEAESDFRELRSRVEGFENTKKPSSHSSIDGVSGNTRVEHRRPHALSWEVRRMSTSSHKAEILSSSLEAFKKIQMERAKMCSSCNSQGNTSICSRADPSLKCLPKKSSVRTVATPLSGGLGSKSRKQNCLGGGSVFAKQNLETSKKTSLSQNSHLPTQMLSSFDCSGTQVPEKDSCSDADMNKKKSSRPHAELEGPVPNKDKVLSESRIEKGLRPVDSLKKSTDKEKDKKSAVSWKPIDAWKEKRNWEDILSSPMRSSSQVSHSPGCRRSMERARVLHDKLMSPERKKKSALDLKREADEKQSRATRIRLELENERVQRLQRTSEKLNRVNEWQAVRSSKMREGLYARHQRGESRHEAYLAQVARRAGDESSKVNEVRFITSLNEENKKLILRQKLHDSEMRRAEKLQIMKTKQKEDLAREEAVLERRKLLEAEKLQRLAEIQRKKEEAQLRREEERKASSAAREARAVEQLRRKEVRARAQQEEAEILAQKLAEKLKESELRRKLYLEQIREKASMDYRDQSSPSLRRSSYKEGHNRSASSNGVEEYQSNCIVGAGVAALVFGTEVQQHSLKRRIKKIRQRLMALKYEFTEFPDGAESVGIGSKSILGAARVKISRWILELQKLRQARKEGATSIGLSVGEIVKFLDGREPELHASRQAGLLDFVAAALPACHTSKPDSCQVTISLLQLLKVLLSLPANRSYFLAQNFLPPIIPMLSAALENYIKIAASLTFPGNTASSYSKTSADNLESISAVLEGFLWSVTSIMGHACTNERQLKMWDGLLDLIVSYRVIHHLRDFFSLYDRPQVEGSPFPSPILLGLNLLKVLSSGCGIISSIDWESGFPKAVEKPLEKDKVVESVGHVSKVGSSFVDKVIVGEASLPLHNNGFGEASAVFGYLNEQEKSLHGQLPLANVQDNVPLDDLNKKNVLVDLSLGVAEVGETMSCTSVKSNNGTSTLQTITISSKSQDSSAKEDMKPLLPQENEKLTREDGYFSQQADIIVDVKNEDAQDTNLREPISFFVSVIAESGLVSLLSLLTAVLLQANNRLSSEQGSYILPTNFEEVAIGVLKVLNSLAVIDMMALQTMLARPDLQMEFFHLMSFFLSYCTSKWKSATDQVGLLLLETLLLLGYFALFHPGNQAVLRWGKSPTILHKVCDLPFVFFSDPDLTPVLAGTLVAACYGCEQNRGVVQQELSMDMLLSVLKSCRQGSLNSRLDHASLENSSMDDTSNANRPALESRRLQADILVKPSRSNQKYSRVVLGKGGFSGGNGRTSKAKPTGNQKDLRGGKGVEASALFLLHNRFPSSFLDKAEEFFSSALKANN